MAKKISSSRSIHFPPDIKANDGRKEKRREADRHAQRRREREHPDSLVPGLLYVTSILGPLHKIYVKMLTVGTSITVQRLERKI